MPILKKQKGFTLLELVMVMALVVLIISIIVPVYGNMQSFAQLDESAYLIVQELRNAQNKSIAGYNDTQSGVYLMINSDGPDTVIGYLGASYAARDNRYDVAFVLPKPLTLSVSGFVTDGNNVDINFARSSGVPDNIGTITLEHAIRGSKEISVIRLGKIELN